MLKQVWMVFGRPGDGTQIRTLPHAHLHILLQSLMPLQTSSRQRVACICMLDGIECTAAARPARDHPHLLRYHLVHKVTMPKAACRNHACRPEHHISHR